MGEQHEVEALRMILAAIMAGHPRPPLAIAQIRGLIAAVQVHAEMDPLADDLQLIAAMQRILEDFS